MSWEEIVNFHTFSDATVYFVMAAVGSVLFILRVTLMLIFGMGDGGFDVDSDGGLDVHDADGFSIFSLMSITAFMTGAGWLGLVARLEWGLGPVLAAVCASGFGGLLMSGTSFGMYQMKKFNQIGGYDVASCVGKLGRVYLTIPAKGEGHGQVQIDVGGRQKVIDAISTTTEIPSFATVKVVDVLHGDTVIVEPHG